MAYSEIAAIDILVFKKTLTMAQILICIPFTKASLNFNKMFNSNKV